MPTTCAPSRAPAAGPPASHQPRQQSKARGPRSFAATHEHKKRKTNKNKARGGEVGPGDGRTGWGRRARPELARARQRQLVRWLERREATSRRGIKRRLPFAWAAGQLPSPPIAYFAAPLCSAAVLLLPRSPEHATQPKGTRGMRWAAFLWEGASSGGARRRPGVSNLLLVVAAARYLYTLLLLPSFLLPPIPHAAPCSISSCCSTRPAISGSFSTPADLGVRNKHAAALLLSSLSVFFNSAGSEISLRPCSILLSRALSYSLFQRMLDEPPQNFLFFFF